MIENFHCKNIRDERSTLLHIPLKKPNQFAGFGILQQDHLFLVHEIYRRQRPEGIQHPPSYILAVIEAIYPSPRSLAAVLLSHPGLPLGVDHHRRQSPVRNQLPYDVVVHKLV